MPLLSETPLPSRAYNECVYAHEVQRKRGQSGLFRHSLSRLLALLGLRAKAFRREEAGKRSWSKDFLEGPLPRYGRGRVGCPSGLPARRQAFA